MKIILTIISPLFVLIGVVFGWYLRNDRIYSAECIKYTDHYEANGRIEGWNQAEEFYRENPDLLK